MIGFSLFLLFVRYREFARYRSRNVAPRFISDWVILVTTPHLAYMLHFFRLQR